MRNPIIATVVLAATCTAPAMAAIDFVGNLDPPGDISTPVPEGAIASLTVQVEVASAVTAGAGQGAGIACVLEWGLPGAPVNDLPMGYVGDAGNNDRYEALLPADGLAPGNYRFRARCSDDGGQTDIYMADNDGLLSITPAPAPPPGNVIVQLFEWKWSDVAQECPFLAGAGYTAVQVSAPNEHLDPAYVSGAPWWVRYQPMSYRLVSRSGSEQAFIDMVGACAAAGIDVYVDAVVNHMSGAGSNAQGIDGTSYTGSSYRYPGIWTPGDFHFCGTNSGQPNVHDLNDFSDRFEVQNCELLGLADLDSGSPAVRTGLGNFLQNLIDIGVAGFRIDAAKHTDASDLRAMLDGLSPAPYVVQEVIDGGGEEVRAWEYLVNGDVTDFGYVYAIGSRFECGDSLAGLSFLNALVADGNNVVVFTDNHDTQRQNNCGISYQTGASAYNLANVFMLAHPYGYPRVMSGYYFDNFNQGPPSSAGQTKDIWVNGEPTGCNAADWVCEHRRPAIANMVRFRQVTAGEAVTDWWDDGNDRIAFGRGTAGFVAINRTANAFTSNYQTSMAAGTYCNVAQYSVVDGLCVVSASGAPAPSAAFVTVDSAGQIVNQTIAANAALAIHSAAFTAVPDTDSDGLIDGDDNCTLVANPGQRDSNGDGFGNVCDPDLDNDGIVNFADLQRLKTAFLAQAGQPAFDPDADFDGDDGINFADLSILKSYLFGPPGPGLGSLEPVCGPPTSGLDPAEAFGSEVFFRGTATGNWAATGGLNNFVNVGGGEYVTELELTTGDYAYKVASADWAVEFANIDAPLVPGVPLVLTDNGGGSPNGVVTVPSHGCWRFSLTTGDPDQPVLLMQPGP